MSTLADIPVVILCGGKGTRMKENGEMRPKPMVEVGKKPILWHIIKIYEAHGFRRFVLPLGYGGKHIKKYFNARGHGVEHLSIEMIDTGVDTLKGGRLKRIEKYLTASHFHVTYGDGVSNVDLKKLHKSHVAHGRMASVTVVRPPSRFGELVLRGKSVQRFEEKPQLSTGQINGGFFVFRRDFLKYLTADKKCDLEFGALQKIASKKELQAFRHQGFWQCMDTPRDRDFLNKLWVKGAPWKSW